MWACGVRPSVTFVDHVKTNKHIFEIFSPSGSHTILVFPYQTGWRYSDGNLLTGASNAGAVGKTRFRTNSWLYWTCVYWCLQHFYRVTKYSRSKSNQIKSIYYIWRNGDWSIYWSFPYQFAPNSSHEDWRSILMMDSNTGTQPNFQKTLSKCGILSPKNSCSHFSSLCQQQLCSGVKNQ